MDEEHSHEEQRLMMWHGPTLARAGLAMLALVFTCGMATAQPAAPSASEPKVLRYSFRVAETGFDPVQISDLYSRTITANLFEAPLQYEFLARPFRYRPNTLVAMPEVSADFKTFTFKVKPGIYFADDPAFKGQRRELVAADYVYAWKRHYDPRWKSPNLYLLANAKIVGLSELREALMKANQPFDYEREVEGLKVIDRYMLQIKTAEPNPRLLLELTDGSVWGAVAREVVEFYGDRIMEHPVGTGPFRLAEWRRASRIVLEKNPGYREQFYDEEAPADDPLAQAAVAQLKGKRLPMIDRVEIAIVNENQPRWLSFLNADHDLLWEVPSEYADLGMPNNQLAPNLKKRKVVMVRYPRADVALSYFNIDDPVVELWQQNMNAIGVRIVFKIANWPDNLKMANNGKLMMWGVGWSAGAPDGQTFLALGDGASKGAANKSRFDLPAYNALFEKQKRLPNGPERQQVMNEAQRLLVAYAPYKLHAHRVFTDFAHPWVLGYHRNTFVREFWKWIDIDVERRRKEGKSS